MQKISTQFRFWKDPYGKIIHPEDLLFVELEPEKNCEKGERRRTKLLRSSIFETVWN
ncbi:MAG TPA: hypothetical protein VGK06_08535 [Methanosarcina sp.]|jgi:hypothetical protein